MQPKDEESLDAVAEWIASAKIVVALTGAGISTDSGIPDFRGEDGVYTRLDEGLEPVKFSWEGVMPNSGHLALVELMQMGKLQFLMSQNNDDLHLASGIPPENLAELHGNRNLWHCIECHAKFRRNEIGWDEEKWGKGFLDDPVTPEMPTCPHCGGAIRSTIVNFREPVPDKEFQLSLRFSKEADVFLAIGTSLEVPPAAYLPRYTFRRGGRFVIINRGETPYDSDANVRISKPIGTVLPLLVQKVKQRLGTE